MWLNVIKKFYNEFYPEYPDDYNPSNFVDAKEIESDQPREKRKIGHTFASDVSVDEALNKLKDKLTEDELSLIEISLDGGEFADVEEHDTQKKWNTIKIRRKDK